MESTDLCRNGWNGCPMAHSSVTTIKVITALFENLGFFFEGGFKHEVQL
jgi:hypothetical protein